MMLIGWYAAGASSALNYVIMMPVSSLILKAWIIQNHQDRYRQE